jgi:transposase
MIQVTAQMRVLVAVEPVDFRKGIDGLAAVCKRELASDPFNGWVFVFKNRKATAVKILVYDGQGFWLAQKRLSSGRFRFWPNARGHSRELEAHELQVLLRAGDPERSMAPEPWKRLSAGL